MPDHVHNPKPAVVVGAGLGGLFSAAILGEHGFEVTVLERLSFRGGRFTQFDMDGFQVPSGAFHSLPGGDYGNIARVIKRLGLDVQCHMPKPACTVYDGRRRQTMPLPLTGVFRRDCWLWSLGPSDWWGLTRMLFTIFHTRKPIPDVDARTFIQTYTNNPEILDVFDSGTRYANAVDSEHASAQDLVTALRVQRRRFEGVVLGGCKSIIDELERKIGEASGRIHTQRPAACIRVEGQRAVAVVDEGGVELPADLVVCNADPKTSTRLLGAHAPEKLCALAEAFVPTHGITYCVGTTEPLVPHDGVELPLGFGGAVAGYHQVSNADPGLAPAGRHFLLAFQPLGLDENVEDAIARGRDELSNIFPSLKQKDVFHISVFQKDWPLAHVQQRLGQCGENRVPLRFPEIENLYFVGHSSVGRGLAAEVVADAALRLDRELGSP